MIPIVSFLAALRFLTEAQTCNNGQGKLVFEKMSGYVINYTRLTTKEIYSSVDSPVKVLEECFRRCKQNELSFNSVDQFCVAFDLIPGERRSSPFQSSLNNNQQISAHYEESKCFLHTLNANGLSNSENNLISNYSKLDSLDKNPSNSDKLTNNQNNDPNYLNDLNNEASNSISVSHSSALINSETLLSSSLMKNPSGWHFSPQCIKSKLITECHRTYAFDRTANHRLIVVDIELESLNRTDCEEKCLEHSELPCRSISFDLSSKKCGLSKETRQSKPDLYKVDPNYEYIENLCLKKKQLCNFVSFFAQRNKEFKGILERELTVASDLYECAMLCVNSLDEKGFFCRTFSYDQSGQTCILYDEPSDVDFVENLDSRTKLSQNNLFSVQCLNEKDDEIWNNSLLELHHKKRLAGPHEVEIISNSPIQCMQECGKRFAYNCKMFEFSIKEQLCRFSSEYVHQRRMVSGSPHLTFDNVYDFYNVISVQNTNDALYQTMPQNLMTHNNIYGSNNYLNDYQLEQALQLQASSAALNMLKSQQAQNSQNRNGIHFNQFLQMNQNRGGYGYERNQGVLNNLDTQNNQNYLQSSSLNVNGPRQFNSINDLSTQQMQRNSFANQPSLLNQRQSSISVVSDSSSPGLVYPSNYNDQTHSSNVQVLNSPNQQVSSNLNVHASSSQLSSSIQQAPSNIVKLGSRNGLLGLSTNNQMNHVYSNMVSSSANSPSPVYGTPYHGPISSSVISLNSPSNSIQSNSISITSNPSNQNPQGSNPTFNIDRCKYPLSLNSNSGNSNNLDTLSSSVAAALLNNKFNKLGFGSRLKSSYIFKVVQANKIEDCERSCIESRDFTCKSFNYRSFFPAENCELSQYDSKQLKLDSPQFFEQHTQYDFYERDISPIANNNAINLLSMGSNDNPNFASECVEVSQSCSPDGMEFTLKTSDKFFGRIYTYGFYDSCYFDGNGGNLNVLKISRANGFPRCGTQQYGDAMTNIVVVQFNDYVQTSRDKKYNLTCYFSGPGEAVITSNYLDTKTDPRHPMQIESLPPQNILTSNVILRVLYRGNPTNVIGVGDLLTFRLEAKSQYRYDLYNSDIFATNVIAKDPYTGRQVLLIDAKGCPADLYVFPELHKTPDGALEAEFYAFKLPDSNFLVFQATVKTCRGHCEPIICSDSGRGQGTFPSWGRRRKRNIEDPLQAIESVQNIVSETVDDSNEKIDNKKLVSDEKEEVHELLRVYSSRADIPRAEALKEQKELNEFDDNLTEKSTRDLSFKQKNKFNEICVTQVHYYSLLVTLILLMIWAAIAISYFIYLTRRKQKKMNSIENLVKLSNCFEKKNDFITEIPNKNIKKDTIYSDVYMVERPRSITEMEYGTVSMDVY